jgi:DNA-binding transcriptional MerR regulator
MLVPLSRTRDYLSIGEVLSSLQDDFPDISISKIRFLESEGLIAPERTASGYRKFFEEDVTRLRYILTLQRDHFLPLKVIKERLAGGGEIVEPAPPTNGKAELETSTRPAAPAGDVQMSRDELLKASGLSGSELDSLEDFGVLPRRDDSYDGDDLMVAKAAKAFFGFGVEARHLKMYRQFAERELGFFEQITGPLARKGDDDSNRTAAETSGRLAALARTMHDATLRSAFRES